MQKALGYVIGLFGAVAVAVMLYVLAQEELGISSESIAAGSLASAGILSLACVVSALARTRK